MHQVDLNVARSHIGHKVNLYLRDGSVIINVLVTKATRSLRGFGSNKRMLHFTAALNRRTRKVPLADVEWMEPVFAVS